MCPKLRPYMKHVKSVLMQRNFLNISSTKLGPLNFHWSGMEGGGKIGCGGS